MILRISHLLGFLGYSSQEKINYPCPPLSWGRVKPTLWLEVLSNINTKIVTQGGHWLNHTRKMVLIKSMLSSLLIYQSSMLLAPRSIMDQVSCLLKGFLWKMGGKGIQDKFHLVSWDTIKILLIDGGLQVRDPSPWLIRFGWNNSLESIHQSRSSCKKIYEEKIL